MPTANSQIKFVPCGKSDYDDLLIKDDNTIYFITDEYRIYVGSNEYTKALEIIQEVPTTSTVGVDSKIYYCTANQTLYHSHHVNAGLYSWAKISNLGMDLAPDISPNDISSLSDGQLFRSTGAIALKVGNASNYIEIAKSASLNGKENTSNKVTSISASSTDTQYPSAKCVYDNLKYCAIELTYNNNDDTYVADKTVKEIFEAVVANKEIVIYYTEFGGYRETRFNVGHARYSSDANDYTIYIYCLHYLADGNVWRFVATGSATSTTGAVFNQITT